MKKILYILGMISIASGSINAMQSMRRGLPAAQQAGKSVLQTSIHQNGKVSSRQGLQGIMKYPQQSFSSRFYSSSPNFSSKDSYKVLGLDSTVSLAEVKKQYRSLMKQYHPDVSVVPDAVQKTKIINEAYEAIVQGRPRRPQKVYEGMSKEAPTSYGKSGSAKSGPSYPLTRIAPMSALSGLAFALGLGLYDMKETDAIINEARTIRYNLEWRDLVELENEIRGKMANVINQTPFLQQKKMRDRKKLLDKIFEVEALKAIYFDKINKMDSELLERKVLDSFESFRIQRDFLKSLIEEYEKHIDLSSQKKSQKHFLSMYEAGTKVYKKLNSFIDKVENKKTKN